MRQQVVMPQMGESIAEGTIIQWHKNPGDKIKKDEILVEISTDKVDSEIPSPYEGVLDEIAVREGETVEVGTIIAYIETEGRPEKREPVTEAGEEAAEEQEEVDRSDGQRQSTPTRVESPERAPEHFYSPLVQSIARKENVSLEELQSITGSGLGGRVRKQDLLKYLEKRKERGPEKGAEPITYAGPMDDVEVIQMDNMRQSIARHMRTSLDTSAHVYSLSEVDMSKVAEFREKHKPEFMREEGFKLTYMPFIIDATIKALKDFPLVNASVDIEKGQILQKKFINIGIAVAIENGLIVPVIKNADERNFLGVAREASRLIVKAREKSLEPDDVQNGTFTITNPGIFGNLYGLPVIHQPQVAILGVGAIKKRPVVINDAIGIRPMMYLSLSYDHRLVDGALGGQFLERIVQYLEDFDGKGLL
ncbi:MAG TPA: dihydrolipoamide acetyltransferase family protein [bacterium]|nr:dihydrolipoamide acetyltransferase family protein [bacterium]